LAEEVCIGLLQIKRSGEVREERRIKSEMIEERVGARAHRGRQIRAEKPAGPADLRRDISSIWRCFDRGGKEGRRRGNRGHYRRGLRAGEARVFGRGRSDGVGGRLAQAGLLAGG
jgi:hypothetical protein